MTMAASKLLSLFGVIAVGAALPLNEAPTVHLENGPYYGMSGVDNGLESFLGMPYAQPPIGDLRFKIPQPLESTWDQPRNATTFQAECFQYERGPVGAGSDDCLTINIIRPAGVDAGADLPVAFWIHGGGLVGGSNSRPAYDLSYFVEESVKIGKPIIAASINYRLHAWGFMWGSAIEAEGAGNLGFRDQRLALEWTRDNIAAFGGDPDKVTIWGQSGGARGVASQVTAFGGRDDGLFRAAIMQSATGFHTDFGENGAQGVTWDEAYGSVLARTGCEGAEDSLQCLREVPAADLAVIFGETTFPSFLDVVDGDFIQEHRAELVRQGKFVHVPVINGITTDDGDYFGRRTINSDEDWEAWLRETGAGNETVAALSALYPDDPSVGLPATFPGRPTGELLAEYGSQWKRAVAFGGDRAMQAPRRAWVKAWADAGLPAYSYRFDVVSGDRSAVQGVGHSAEMPFVMRNLELLKGADPDREIPASFDDLSTRIATRWIGFVTELDPNLGIGRFCVPWPEYETEEGVNLVFSVNRSSLAYLEPDTFRAEQFAFLDSKLWQIGLE